MSTPSKISEEIRQKIYKMADQGVYVKDIAEAVGIPKGTVGGIVAKYRKTNDSLMIRHAHLTDGEKRQILAMAEAGYKYADICEAMGVGKNTVQRCVSNMGFRKMKPYEYKDSIQTRNKGFNADRRLCHTCKYRNRDLTYKEGAKKTQSGYPGCDYYIHEDVERGCDVEVCDKYQKGDSITRERAKQERKEEIKKSNLTSKEFEKIARALGRKRPDIARALRALD